jgi:hypothetical protein
MIVIGLLVVRIVLLVVRHGIVFAISEMNERPFSKEKASRKERKHQGGARYTLIAKC